MEKNDKEQNLFAITLRTTSAGKVYGDVTVKADNEKDLQERLAIAKNILAKEMLSPM